MPRYNAVYSCATLEFIEARSAVRQQRVNIVLLGAKNYGAVLYHIYIGRKGRAFNV